MDIQQAKELVIRAGKEVVASGLIARTWGNISCRVSDTQFVITPSGRAYEDLTPDEIVLVNIADLSYDGDIKPSSEKGIHAEAYKLRPEVNFVIHTHQMLASVISALGFDINSVEATSAEIVGDNVPLAAYGLPGTGKLRKGVVAAMQRSDSKAVIMAHHGALCMGEDYADAFAVASELEKICESSLRRKYSEVTGTIAAGLDAVYDYIGEKFADAKRSEATRFPACNSARDGSVFHLSAVNLIRAVNTAHERRESGDIALGGVHRFQVLDCHFCLVARRSFGYKRLVLVASLILASGAVEKHGKLQLSLPCLSRAWIIAHKLAESGFRFAVVVEGNVSLGLFIEGFRRIY